MCIHRESAQERERQRQINRGRVFTLDLEECAALLDKTSIGGRCEREREAAREREREGERERAQRERVQDSVCTTRRGGVSSTG